MITATIGGIDKTFDVAGYSVGEYASPLVPGDTSGGATSVNLDIISTEDQALINRVLGAVGQRINLTDSQSVDDGPFRGRGTISGTISTANERGNLISIGVDTVLTRLNSEQTAEAFFGVRRTGVLTTYIVNLATNPSLETATTGYAAIAGASGTAALSRVASGSAYAGAYVGRVTWSAAATGPGGASYTHPGIVAESRYTVSAYVLASSIQQMQIVISWRNASNAEIGTKTGVVSQAAAGQWVRVFLIGATPPIGATSAVIKILNSGSDSGGNWAASDTLDFDALMITQGGELFDYGDGSYPNASWQSTPNASASQLAIMTEQDEGVDATIGNAFRYYLSLAGIQTSNISVSPELEQIPVAYTGWTGNLMDIVKQFCTANMVEVRVVNDVIYLQRPRQRKLRISETGMIDRSVSTQSVARAVGIANYNNSWRTDSLVYSADSAYQIDTLDNTETYVTIPHSLSSVNSPVCVAAINPDPYVSGTGQYVVTDSANNVVNPDTWTSHGGNVSAALDRINHPGTVRIRISAPTSILPGYTAPYRIVEYSGKDVPAMYITGTGVFVDKQTITIETGTSAEQTSRESASAIDNIFISDNSQAHDRGSEAGGFYTGPNVSISFSIGFDPDANGQEFGNIAGRRIYAKDGIYRVTSATITPGGIQGEAAMDVTFDDLSDLFATTFNEFNATYDTLTFDQFNALFTSTTTFDDFNAGSGSPTMDDFNAIYEGATFNAHAVYPYLGKAVVDNAEARI